MGDMYGPIMPVMKNMGKKLTMTAKGSTDQRRSNLGDGFQNNLGTGDPAMLEVPPPVAAPFQLVFPRAWENPRNLGRAVTPSAPRHEYAPDPAACSD